VSVVEARVATAASAHHEDGHLRAEQLADHVAQSENLGFDAGIALHQCDVAERIGGALCKIGVVALDRGLPGFRLAEHEGGQRGEDYAQNDQKQRKPPVEENGQRQQHQQRNEGGEVLAEEAEPEPPQRIRAG
jgi:hypothetical protein